MLCAGIHKKHWTPKQISDDKKKKGEELFTKFTSICHIMMNTEKGLDWQLPFKLGALPQATAFSLFCIQWLALFQNDFMIC